MFIRKRTTQTKGHGTTTHYQVLESYRDNGKVKQRVLCNLGNQSTPEARLTKLHDKLAQTEESLISWNNPTAYWMRRRQKRVLESLNHNHRFLLDEIVKVQNVMSQMTPMGPIFDTTMTNPDLNHRSIWIA